MGGYDSIQHWCIADPTNLGQVLHDGTRVSTAVCDGTRVELHGSMRCSELACIELVIIAVVDFEGLEGVVADVESGHMNITTLLEDKANAPALLLVMLVSMPPQADNHQTEMRVVFEEPCVSALMVVRCPNKLWLKGSLHQRPRTARLFNCSCTN